MQYCATYVITMTLEIGSVLIEWDYQCLITLRHSNDFASFSMFLAFDVQSAPQIFLCKVNLDKVVAESFLYYALQQGLNDLHEMPVLWLAPKILFRKSHGQI